MDLSVGFDGCMCNFLIILIDRKMASGRENANFTFFLFFKINFRYEKGRLYNYRIVYSNCL